MRNILKLAVAALLMGFCAFILVSCGAGDVDSDTDFKDGEVELKISDVRNPDSDKHPLPETEVYLPEIVVMSQKFVVSKGSNLRGFFASDPESGPYSGILIVLFGSADMEVMPGDRFSIRGTYTEFCGVTTIYPTCSCQIEVSEHALRLEGGEIPEPVYVEDHEELVAEKSLSLVYQNTLVTIGPVKIESGPNTYREYTLSGGLKVDDMIFENKNVAVGSTIERLTGFLYFSYGENKLEPRDAADWGLQEQE